MLALQVWTRKSNSIQKTLIIPQGAILLFSSTGRKFQWLSLRDRWTRSEHSTTRPSWWWNVCVHICQKIGLGWGGVGWGCAGVGEGSLMSMLSQYTNHSCSCLFLPKSTQHWIHPKEMKEREEKIYTFLKQASNQQPLLSARPSTQNLTQFHWVSHHFTV